MKSQSRFQRYLPVQLTEAELNAYARELAARTNRHVEIEDADKGAKARMRDDSKARQAAIDALAQKIARGTEPRNVECEEHIDEGSWCVITIRMDTGEQVSTRQMTDTEIQAYRQGELRLGSEPVEVEMEVSE